jgi:hypothetical protein
MIFLHTLTNFWNRQTAERSQDSDSTVSIIIHQVSRSILTCRSLIFQPVQANSPIPVQISQNPKFFPFFKDCVGALDGSHIPAVVPLEEQGVFRNWKKFIRQNLLAVSNFDMTFAYALAGWECGWKDPWTWTWTRKRKGMSENKMCLIACRGS